MPTTDTRTVKPVQGYVCVHDLTFFETDSTSHIITKDIVYGAESSRHFKDWVRTPNFRMLKAQGNLPLNPYERLKTYNGGLNVRSRTSTYLQVGPDVDPQGVPHGFISRKVEDSCPGVVFALVPEYGNFQSRFAMDAKLVAKMKGQQWALPVFVGELGATVDLVTSTATRIYRSYKALRRGDLRAFARVLRLEQPSNRKVAKFNRGYGRNARDAAASTWLEYSYGWVPLLADVYDAAELLAEQVSQKPDWTLVTVRATTRESRKTSLTGSSSTGEITKYAYRADTTSNSSLRGVWRFHPLPGTLPAKLGLANPLYVAWNLLPLSFVADWFLPIGDYLDALDAPLHYRHKDFTVGVHVDSTRDYTNIGEGTWDTFSTGAIYDRAIVQGGPPDPSITDMRFKIPNTWQKAVSAISLLQVFRK